MEIYVEGQMVKKLPYLTREEKLRKLNELSQSFWNTPLRRFWQNAYFSYRDKIKKAGKHEATRNPADNGNHDDGKPAA